MQLRLKWCGLLLCSSLLCATAQAKTLALVIGIDSYQKKPLDGAVNDAKDIYNALVNYATEAKNVTLLANKEASKQAIQNAWDNMVRRSVVGDTLIVTYAGHGSQITDHEQDEKDGKDEVFLLSGFREASADASNELIRDDDWYRWFTAAEGRQVVFVVDACHSGTMHRSLDANAKSRYQKISTTATPPPQHVKIKEHAIQDYVTIFAATTENMDSYERKINGKARGALSYAFAEAIRGAADDGDKTLLKQELELYLFNTITALTKGTNKQIPQFVPEGFNNKALIRLNRSASKTEISPSNSAFDVYFKQGNVNHSGSTVSLHITHPPYPYLTLYNLAADNTVQFLYPHQNDQPRIATDSPFILNLDTDSIHGDEQLVAILSNKRLSDLHAFLRKYNKNPANNLFDTQLSTLLAHETFEIKRIQHKIKP